MYPTKEQQEFIISNFDPQITTVTWDGDVMVIDLTGPNKEIARFRWTQGDFNRVLESVNKEILPQYQKKMTDLVASTPKNKRTHYLFAIVNGVELIAFDAKSLQMVKLSSQELITSVTDWSLFRDEDVLVISRKPDTKPMHIRAQNGNNPAHSIFTRYLTSYWEHPLAVFRAQTMELVFRTNDYVA